MSWDRPTAAGPPARVARQGSLREHNLSVVLAEIRRSPAARSRAEIAAATGMTRATVSALVDQLVSAGFLTELPPPIERRVGRPGVPVCLASGTMAAVGLEANVDYLGARAVDLAGHVIASHTKAGDYRHREPAEVLNELTQIATTVLGELAQAGVRVLGVTVAFPGLVDGPSGPIRLAPNLHWLDVELTSFFAAAPFAQLECRAGNEATLAAYAELSVRGGELPEFIYVSGEVGIGAALVSGGAVYRGAHGWSGELGHTSIEPRGPRCVCGARGCLEQYAGLDALKTAAGLPLDAPTTAIVDRLAERDPATRAGVRRAGWALGCAISNYLNLIDASDVVLGGAYLPLIDALEPSVMKELSQRVLSARWSTLRLHAAQSGPDASMVGGAMSIITDVLAAPAQWLPEPEG